MWPLDIERTHNFVAEGIVTHNSIYKFRGADYRNLMRFEEVFPDATVIVLEQNYRSSQNILDAANAVIANNAARQPKQLWTEQIGGELITRYHAKDEHDEAAFVVHEIARLVDTEGQRFGDVAVFYRTNAQSRVVEEALVRAGVPYRVVGGVKFYDRREVKDILAYLRALVNPDDEVSWRRVVNTPKRGVGDTSINRVAAYAQGAGVTFRDALGHAADAGVAGKALGGIRDLLELAWRARGVSTAGVASPTVEAVLEQTGYLAELEAERSIEAQGRIENLQELVGVCREFDEALDAGDVSGLPGIAGVGAAESAAGDIVDPSSGSPGSRRSSRRSRSSPTSTAARASEQSAVTLMTLHTAKGLEFPVGVPHRPGRRRVPARAQPRRSRRARGGTAALLRRHHPGPRAALPVPRVEPDAVRRHRLLPAEPVPRRDPRGAGARCSARPAGAPTAGATATGARHRDAVVSAALAAP